MDSYEANINKLDSKLNHYNNPIGISLNIEYIMLVPYVVGTIKGGFHICKSSPLTSFHYRNPFL